MSNIDIKSDKFTFNLDNTSSDKPVNLTGSGFDLLNKESTASTKSKFQFSFNSQKIAANEDNKSFIQNKNIEHYTHNTNSNSSLKTKQVFAFESLNKKERFEQFLTYRKRLSRLAFVQGCYLYEISFLTNDANVIDEKTTDGDNINSQHIDKSINTDDIVKSVIFLYRNVFFYGRYGPINKKKKLEEKWLYDCMADITRFLSDLDDRIREKLSSKWTVYKLDPTVRAILRCAIYEMLYFPSIGKKIVVSEYVKLSTAFYDDPKVFGFINGLLDSIAKSIE